MIRIEQVALQVSLSSPMLAVTGRARRAEGQCTPIEHPRETSPGVSSSAVSTSLAVIGF